MSTRTTKKNSKHKTKRKRPKCTTRDKEVGSKPCPSPRRSHMYYRLDEKYLHLIVFSFYIDLFIRWFGPTASTYWLAIAPPRISSMWTNKDELGDPLLVHTDNPDSPQRQCNHCLVSQPAHKTVNPTNLERAFFSPVKRNIIITPFSIKFDNLKESLLSTCALFCMVTT